MHFKKVVLTKWSLLQTFHPLNGELVHSHVQHCVQPYRDLHHEWSNDFKDYVIMKHSLVISHWRLYKDFPGFQVHNQTLADFFKLLLCGGLRDFSS